MARLSRYVLPGVPQHIIQRGNNCEVIFAHESDYAAYLDWLAEAAEANGLHVHAYVLMTNHVHLLATPDAENSIGRTMQSLGRRYVQHFNHRYQRTGTLWEGRYRATVIEAETWLMRCSQYIEMNPVRAGMVRSPAHFPWSSYRHNAMGRDDALISPHALYKRLGRDAEQRQAAYRELFKTRKYGVRLDILTAVPNCRTVCPTQGTKRLPSWLDFRVTFCPVCRSTLSSAAITVR